MGFFHTIFLSDGFRPVRPLPFGNLTLGVSGDYQIAPLPRSGKGRWRPLAAGRNKKENGFPRARCATSATLRRTTQCEHWAASQREAGSSAPAGAGNGFPRQCEHWLGMTGQGQGAGAVDGCRGGRPHAAAVCAYITGHRPLALPLGELSPQVTERAGMVMVCPLRPRCARPPLPEGEARDAHTAHQNVCRGGRLCPPGI